MVEKVFAGFASILSVVGAVFVIISFVYDTETDFEWKELYYKICCGYKIRDGDGRDKGAGNKYRMKSYNIILIHLSVADIIVATSHLWGLCSNLEKTFFNSTAIQEMGGTSSAVAAGQDTNCITQATFTIISTLASFFWTDILAVFLALNIVFTGCTNNFMTGLDRDSSHKRVVIPEETKAPHCCESPFFLHILFPLVGWGVPMLMVMVFAVKDLLGYNNDYDQGT